VNFAKDLPIGLFDFPGHWNLARKNSPRRT
jgi:hypothetical protein